MHGLATSIHNLPFPLPFGCLTHCTHVLVGQRKSVHPTPRHQWSVGGCGQVYGKKAQGALVPRPADARERLQGFHG